MNATLSTWILGPFLTLFALAAVEGLATAALKIPNPAAVYLTAVVYAAFRGGLGPGLLSAAITVLYAVYFFSTPGALFHYTHDQALRLVVLAVTTPSIALMVGLLKRRVDQMSARRYRRRIDQEPLGLYRASPTGQILEANLALVQMLAYPDPQTLVARNVADLFAKPEAHQRWQARLDRDGAVCEAAAQFRQRDGTDIRVRHCVQAVKDFQGRVLYYDGAVEDITELIRLGEELRS